MIRTILTLITVALGVASAATFRVTLVEPTMVGGTTLKAGDYKIEVIGDKAVFKSGKQTAETPVKVESTNQKFNPTTCGYHRAADGTMKLRELRIGGSSTRLVFPD
jgi:hypothetical protein